MKMQKRLYALCLSLILTAFCLVSFSCPVTAAPASYEATSLASLSGKNRYEQYRTAYADAPSPVSSYDIDITKYTADTDAMEILDTFSEKSGVLRWTAQDSTVSWTVIVPEAGLYRLALDYYPSPERTGNIEFQAAINHETPFDEALQIIFPRLWQDKNHITQDNRNNDLRPAQVCADGWLSGDFSDKDGIYNQPYQFYFSEGENTVSLKLLRDAVYIGGLRVYNPEPLKSYEQYRNGLPSIDKTSGLFKKYQAEVTKYKSAPSLFPTTDRSDPLSEPYDPGKLKLNTIGGGNWKNAGQWISWEVDVPESGDYIIGLRFRQDVLKGMDSYRRVTVDGELLFSELDCMAYGYNKSWRTEALGAEGEPFLFRLDKGTHTIAMEVVTGDTGQTVSVAENAIYEMNYLYRKIIMITGVTPDIYRDYDLEADIPTLSSDFSAVADSLRTEIDRLEARTGRANSNTALMREVQIQLESLAKDPESVISRLDRYKNNITALSAAMISMREKPLELDYLFIASPETPMPRAKAGLGELLINGFRTFFSSFVEDYGFVGSVSGQAAVEVWVMSGRDQAQITKSLIDSGFTPDTGIQVNLSHVKGTLMEAAMAGKGPDVALGVGRTQPADLALRNALLPLDTFPDFDAVKQDFQSTAFVPYTINGHVYAMPETQLFDMMFYRTDIFGELGLTPPETWDDFYAIVQTIARHNLDIGLPSLAAQTAAANTPFPKTFGNMLLQNGLSYFNPSLSATAFDSAEAGDVFSQYIELYRDYALPVFYDFANRFRSGEMPLGIAPYSTFNTLYILAPEIRNLWAMKPIFGIRNEDGTINNSCEGDGSAAIVFKNAPRPDDAAAFVNWWVGEQAQTLYAREMESVLGPAARLTTANRKAFENLPWSTAEKRSLNAQWDSVIEQPVIPGSYFMSRSLNNAVMEAVYENGNPLATLQKYNKAINAEMARKRQEFGLE